MYLLMAVSSLGGRQERRQLRATGKTPDGTSTREYVEEVRYDLPPAEEESDEAAAKLRDDRNRRREQLALERLAKAPEAEEEAQRASEANGKVAAERAKEEARLQRMAAVVRDGNTLYVHDTRHGDEPVFRPVDARTSLGCRRTLLGLLRAI